MRLYYKLSCTLLNPLAVQAENSWRLIKKKSNVTFLFFAYTLLCRSTFCIKKLKWVHRYLIFVFWTIVLIIRSSSMVFTVYKKDNVNYQQTTVWVWLTVHVEYSCSYTIAKYHQWTCIISLLVLSLSPLQWSSEIYYHIGTGIRTLTVFILIHKDKNSHAA